MRSLPPWRLQCSQRDRNKQENKWQSIHHTNDNSLTLENWCSGSFPFAFMHIFFLLFLFLWLCLFASFVPLFLTFSSFLFVKLVQLLSCVQLFATPWTAAHQASLSFTISWSRLNLVSTESMMPSNQWVGSSHQVAKAASGGHQELQLQHQSFQ